MTEQRKPRWNVKSRIGICDFLYLFEDIFAVFVRGNCSLPIVKVRNLKGASWLV